MLGSCSVENWQETKEEAVETGLKTEGIDKESVLSIEEYKGETLVLFEYEDALGVASIQENNKGYKWQRYSPYKDIEVKGELPYSTIGFDIETDSGVNISILVGKVFVSGIQSLTLTGDGAEKTLKVYEDSGLFYAIHEAPYGNLKIIN